MKKAVKILLVVFILSIICTIFTGCIKPYDKPELVTIEPSQTAFLIPLIGETSNQKEFMSEKYLENTKVATKQVQIPHRWIQTGRRTYKGEWIASMRLIIVERKPETREWTEATGTGTSSENEGIVAESKDSIGFMARMNCSAQIDEGNAVRFLYRYNNKSLAEIMDFEIRARAESKFVEECSKLPLSGTEEQKGVLESKEEIMKMIREDVTNYFAERGITITTIGLKGEFTYLDADIQKAINDKFKSSQMLITQKNENERVISKAVADAEAIRKQAETIKYQIELKQLENAAEAIRKWDGKMPEYVSGESGAIFSIPMK